VSKIKADGSALIYSTFLGGNALDISSAIAVDAGGNAYIIGETQSTDFPTVAALQPNKSSGRDVFVTKLNPAGAALLYSTYQGGLSDEFGRGITVGPSGNVYLTGYTNSSDYPTATPIQASKASNFDLFIAKLTDSFDLSIAMSASPSPVLVEDNLVYSITVNNTGEKAANGVTVTDALPSGATFVSATASQGTCSGTSTVTCNLGSINAGAGATVSITIKPSSAGTINNTATVSSSDSEANTANNSATQSTQVQQPTPPVSSLQFAQSSYTVSENAVFLNISLTRTGDLSAAATVKYATSDATDVNFQCNPSTAGQPTGGASRKCDYHIAAGRLRFAPGEDTKQITLSVVNDAYVEGPETFTLTLSNPTGMTLGANTAATVTITDNDTAAGANPIDATSFYVRQLYVDLLSREPDQAGWDGWTSRIDLCGQPGQAPPPCDRVTVGGDGFLNSGEFFDRQFFVLKLYRTGLGRILVYDEVGDLAYVSGFLSNADLELNKQELVADIMSRPEFANKYNHLSNATFVDTLLQTAGVTVPQSVRDAWVTALNGSTQSRAQVYREISERAEVSAKYLHEAQVVSAYYGFFSRNPDGAAYSSYLPRLQSGEINQSDLANAFINSQEYRQRFGN
jgi:uncharacterized repeat protein (TIGR01451 family)